MYFLNCYILLFISNEKMKDNVICKLIDELNSLVLLK